MKKEIKQKTKGALSLAGALAKLPSLPPFPARHSVAQDLPLISKPISLTKGTFLKMASSTNRITPSLRGISPSTTAWLNNAVLRRCNSLTSIDFSSGVLAQAGHPTAGHRYVWGAGKQARNEERGEGGRKRGREGGREKDRQYVEK